MTFLSWAAIAIFGETVYIRRRYQEALEERARRLEADHDERARLARRGIASATVAHRLDAIVAPTIGTPWTIDLLNGQAVEFGSTGPSQAAGWPSITVPAGFVGEVRSVCRSWPGRGRSRNGSSTPSRSSSTCVRGMLRSS